MLREQRPAVHPVGEEDVVAERLVERKAALVLLLLAALDAAVEPAEDHLDGVVVEPGLGEDRRERRPRPGTGADRLGEPRLADRPRVGEERAPVPGALHRHLELDRRPRAQIVERQGERPLDAPVDRRAAKPAASTAGMS